METKPARLGSNPMMIYLLVNKYTINIQTAALQCQGSHRQNPDDKLLGTSGSLALGSLGDDGSQIE